MVTLASSSGKPRYTIKEYYLDTPVDLTELMKYNSDYTGSIAHIISTGERYVQNSSGQWILQPACGGGSGGGGSGGTGSPGVSIVGVTVNDQNHLLCTMSNGATIDAGEIKVKPGTSISHVSINSNNHLIVTLSDNTTIDAGLIPTVGIKSVKVDSNNHLQITLTNNTTIDAGEITTQQGEQGLSVKSLRIDPTTYHLICTLSDGTEINAGKIPAGQDGTPGKDGIGIANIVIDKNQHLICVLTDGTTIDAGELPIAEDETVYIVDLTINEDNYLIAQMSDGHQKLVGKLTGDGCLCAISVTKVEIDENNHIQISYSDGSKEDIGEIAVNVDIGVKSLKLNEDNELIAVMGDGSEVVIATLPQIINSVVSVSLDDNNDLKITMADNSENIVEIKRIVKLSENEDHIIVATMADGTEVETEILAGISEAVISVAFDSDNHLKVTHRDGTVDDLGEITGGTTEDIWATKPDIDKMFEDTGTFDPTDYWAIKPDIDKMFEDDSAAPDLTDYWATRPDIDKFFN